MSEVVTIRKIQIGDDEFQITAKYPYVVITKNGEEILSIHQRLFEEFVRGIA